MSGQLQDDLFNVEPVTEGEPNLASPLVVVEPITESDVTNLANALVLVEPLTESVRHLLMNLLMVESLQPVLPENEMVTTPFPGFGNSTVDPTKPAGADPFNTKLPGLTFSVHKKPSFRTSRFSAAAGNEVRNALMQYPIWTFQMTYDFLEDRTGAESSLKTIMGFYLQCLGGFAEWLFKDPDDYLVTNGLLGVADGTITEFTFLRELGGFFEKIGQVDDTNTINIYIDDVLVDPGDYTLTTNSVIFTTAPASGNVTADFQFFFVCTFVEDELDFEKFMDKLWNLQECDFKSVIKD